LVADPVPVRAGLERNRFTGQNLEEHHPEETMKFLEEYCTENAEGRLTKYRGSRLLDVLPPGRGLGAQNGETLTLSEPLTIYAGGVNRKPVGLPQGVKVWRWITPLEGRR
jgi:hypothetical protein